MTITKLIVILLIAFVLILCLVFCILDAIKDLNRMNCLQTKLDDLAKEIEKKEAEAKFYASINNYIKNHTKN